MQTQKAYAMQLQQLTTDEEDAREGLLDLMRAGLSPADTDRPQKMQRSDNSCNVRDFLKKSAIEMQESKRGPLTARDISSKCVTSAKPHAGHIARKATILCNGPKKKCSAPSQQKQALQHVALAMPTYLVPQYYMPFIPPAADQCVFKRVRTGEGSRPSMPQVDRDPRAHMNSAATQAGQTYTGPQVLMKHAETQTERVVKGSIKSTATQTSSTTHPAAKTLRDMILTKHWHICKVCA